MSEAKFTKGPWVFEDGWLYGKDNGFTVEIAAVDFNEAEVEFHQGNKALIAAAPDLYEAAEIALNRLVLSGGKSGQFLGQHDKAIIEKLSAALAKARGKAA